MRARRFVAIVLLLTAGLFVPGQDAEGQILRRLGRVAANAAESELANTVDRLVRDAVRCTVGDTQCQNDARARGKEVIFTDANGAIITGDDGVPITDPAAAAARAGVPERPGTGVWANYDFIPGDEVLFYEDFTSDRVGAFPRRMEFASGNWEIVEWQGRRLLRSTGPRAAALKIMLPNALPERFTIEFDVYTSHVYNSLVLAPTPPANQNVSGVRGHYFHIKSNETGVKAPANGSTSLNPAKEIEEGLVPIRIHVDGQYARVYVRERRVANIPNAEFLRSDELWVQDAYGATADRPIYIGPIRIAEGGGDLYQRLEADGRVITQGVLFAVNSATLQPESTPTLNEIGQMLSQHGALRLRIEGHTDSTGDPDTNLDLSKRRADAVRDFLVEHHGIARGRLETEGLGQTKPVANNSSPEGRQNNRRVELVRLGGGEN